MFVSKVIAQVYKGDTSTEDAIKILAQGMSREQLAEFIVDAFNRGWINRFNLGINEDGNLS